MGEDVLILMYGWVVRFMHLTWPYVLFLHGEHLWSHRGLSGQAFLDVLHNYLAIGESVVLLEGDLPLAALVLLWTAYLNCAHVRAHLAFNRLEALHLPGVLYSTNYNGAIKYFWVRFFPPLFCAGGRALACACSACSLCDNPWGAYN